MELPISVLDILSKMFKKNLLWESKTPRFYSFSPSLNKQYCYYTSNASILNNFLIEVVLQKAIYSKYKRYKAKDTWVIKKPFKNKWAKK